MHSFQVHLLEILLLLHLVSDVYTFTSNPFTTKFGHNIRSDLNLKLNLNAIHVNHANVEDEGQSKSDETQQFRLAVYQPPYPTTAAIAVENPVGILTQVTECLVLASKSKIDFVLFPELFLTGGPQTFPFNKPKGPLSLEARARALDRESYELSIIGNLCAELNVACAIGYAESKHESESQFDDINSKENVDGDVFNSVAVFHADGSRAGNFRCTCTASTNGFLNAHPFVEAFPVNLRLPVRDEPTRLVKELKVGVTIGNEFIVPEHCRHLVRSGAQVLLSLSSFHSLSYADNDNDHDDLEDDSSPCLLQLQCLHIPQIRAMENDVLVMLSNYVGSIDSCSDSESGRTTFGGSSGITSSQGKKLVLAPDTEEGDMPCDKGYLLPCTIGALYAADIDMNIHAGSGSIFKHGDMNIIQSSRELWDLMPRNPTVIESKSNETKGPSSNSHGFGREVKRVIQKQRSKRKRTSRK